MPLQSHLESFLIPQQHTTLITTHLIYLSPSLLTRRECKQYHWHIKSDSLIPAAQMIRKAQLAAYNYLNIGNVSRISVSYQTDIVRHLWQNA